MKKNSLESTRRFMIVALLAAAFAVCFSGMAFAAKYVPGEALVLLKNGIGEMSAASLERSAGDGYVKSVASKAGASVVRTYNALSMESGSIFVHMKSDTKSTDELIAELNSNPDVINASPNYIKRALAQPKDPRYVQQWALGNIGAEAAWDISTGSPDVYVAVMDTGIDIGHEDLKDNLDTVNSRNFTTANSYQDGEGHGTHVSGIIGAVGSNDKGIAGINWNLKIISLKVLDDTGSGSDSMQIAAFNHIIGMLTKSPDMVLPVVNLSLGGWEPGNPQEAQNTTYWDAFKRLDDTNRTVIVVAAGNEAFEVGAPAPFSSPGQEIDQGDYCYPASFTGLNNLIVVGSTNKADGGSEFTNWSSKFVHIAAPGGEYTADQTNEGILSTSTIPGGYDFDSGTSMAAPHVAGAVALLASKYPNSTASQLKAHVLAKADSNTNPTAPAKDLDSGQTVPNRVATDKKVSIHGRLDLTNLLSDAPADIKVTSIALGGASTMTVGKTQTLTATVKPDNATDKTLDWTTSDSAVATVSSSGLVAAVKDGKVTITATAKDGSGIFGSKDITVGSNTGTSTGSSGCAAGSAGLAGLALALFFVRRGTSGKKD